eukprot:243-Rhodomonas_salina.1
MKGKDEFVVCKGKGFKLDVKRKARADLIPSSFFLQAINQSGTMLIFEVSRVQMLLGDLLAPCFCGCFFPPSTFLRSVMVSAMDVWVGLELKWRADTRVWMWCLRSGWPT